MKKQTEFETPKMSSYKLTVESIGLLTKAHGMMLANVAKHAELVAELQKTFLLNPLDVNLKSTVNKFVKEQREQEFLLSKLCYLLDSAGVLSAYFTCSTLYGFLVDDVNHLEPVSQNLFEFVVGLIGELKFESSLHTKEDDLIFSGKFFPKRDETTNKNTYLPQDSKFPAFPRRKR